MFKEISLTLWDRLKRLTSTMQNKEAAVVF